MFVTDWHRHWGNSTVDTGNSSYTMMSHYPEWLMIFWIRPSKPSTPRIYLYFRSWSNRMWHFCRIEATGVACKQEMLTLPGHLISLLVLGVRFFSYGGSLCLLSLVPILSWFCMPLGLWFLICRFCTLYRDMVLVHICHALWQRWRNLIVLVGKIDYEKTKVNQVSINMKGSIATEYVMS